MFPAILSVPLTIQPCALPMGAPKVGFAALLTMNDRQEVLSATEAASSRSRPASSRARKDGALREASQKIVTNTVSEVQEAPADSLRQPAPPHESGVSLIPIALQKTPVRALMSGRLEPELSTTGVVNEPPKIVKAGLAKVAADHATAPSRELVTTSIFSSSRTQLDVAGAMMSPSVRVKAIFSQPASAIPMPATDSTVSAQVADTELHAPVLDNFSAAKNESTPLPPTASAGAPTSHPLNNLEPKPSSEPMSPKVSGDSWREIPSSELQKLLGGDLSASGCHASQADRTTNSPRVAQLCDPISSDFGSATVRTASEATPVGRDTQSLGIAAFQLPIENEAANPASPLLSSVELWSDASGAFSSEVPQSTMRPRSGVVAPGTTKAPVMDAPLAAHATSSDLHLVSKTQDVQPAAGANPIQQKQQTKVEIPETDGQHLFQGAAVSSQAAEISTVTQPVAPAANKTDEAVPTAPPPQAVPGDTAWNALQAPKAQTIEAGATELQLNVRTDSLGRVEIHAAVHDSHVTASIAVENGGARGAVASEFSQLNQALGAHDLRLDAASVSVAGETRQGGFDFGGHGGRQFHREPAQPQSSGPRTTIPEEENDDLGEGKLNVIA